MKVFFFSKELKLIFRMTTEEDKNIRRHYLKTIQTEIRQLERFRDQASKRSSADNIKRFDEKIKQLQTELEEEMTPRYIGFHGEQQALIKMQKKNHEKSLELGANASNQEAIQAVYQKENQLRRDDRYAQHVARREWDWLCNQEAKLPDYIRENLAKMPCNKGYIWKGIWYFGKQSEDPRDRGVIIMFERQRGGDQLIHELKPGHFHRVLRKNKNPPHVLLSETYLK